jgi:hypothetical protein
MTAPDPPLASLNELLEACEGLSVEPHLRPYHLAVRVAVTGALDDAVADALDQLYAHRPGRLVWRDAGDWKDAITGAYLFWAGFVPSPTAAPPAFERDEHRALKAQIIGAVGAMVGAGAQAAWLGGEDADGKSLCPTGGLHQYLVLADERGRLLLDFCWDS